MEWTRDKPKQAGWFWYCWDYFARPELVELWLYSKDSEPLLCGDHGGNTFEDYDGYWLGPVDYPLNPADADNAKEALDSHEASAADEGMAANA